MMTNGCIICYRVNLPSFPSTSLLSESEIKCDNDGVNNSTSGKGADKLKLFFQLLERHLDGGHQEVKFGSGGLGQLFRWLPILDQIAQTGIDLFCGDCSKVVDSYCDLYHQMRSIELLLNWKLAKLKNIMEEANGSPQREQDFGDWVKQLAVVEVEGGGANPGVQPELVKWMSNFKNDIINKIGRKAQTTLPRVPLDKCQIPQKEPKNNWDQLSSGHKDDGLISNPDLDTQSATLLRTKDADLAAPAEVKVEPSLPQQHVKVEPCDEAVDDPPMCVLVATATVEENSIDISNTIVKTEPQLIVPDPLADPLAGDVDLDMGAAPTRSHGLLISTEEMETEQDIEPGNLAEGPSPSFPTVAGVDYLDFDHRLNRPPVTLYSPASHSTGTSSEGRRSRQLRSVYRCAKCRKSFSTPDKLMQHQLAHDEKDEDWEKLSSSSSVSSKGSSPNKDDLEESDVPNSDSGSEYNSDEELEEKLSDEDDNAKSLRRRRMRQSYAGAAPWSTPWSNLGRPGKYPPEAEITGINGASVHAQLRDMEMQTSFVPATVTSLSESGSERRVRRRVNPLFPSKQDPFNQTAPRGLQRPSEPGSFSTGMPSGPPHIQMPKLTTAKPPKNFLKTASVPPSNAQSLREQYNLHLQSVPPNRAIPWPVKVTTSCKTCKAKFFALDQATLISKLRTHKETHHKKKKTGLEGGGDASAPAPSGSARHNCYQCTASFKNAFQLQAHIFTKHGIAQKPVQLPLPSISKVKNDKKRKELPKM